MVRVATHKVIILLLLVLAVTASASKSWQCELRKDTGPCKKFVTRYYYDRLWESCRSFRYGGCGGNANNFKTVYQCRSKCE